MEKKDLFAELRERMKNVSVENLRKAAEENKRKAEDAKPVITIEERRKINKEMAMRVKFKEMLEKVREEKAKKEEEKTPEENKGE